MTPIVTKKCLPSYNGIDNYIDKYKKSTSINFTSERFSAGKN